MHQLTNSDHVYIGVRPDKNREPQNLKAAWSHSKLSVCPFSFPKDLSQSHHITLFRDFVFSFGFEPIKIALLINFKDVVLKS
jgi:hypothetical protein